MTGKESGSVFTSLKTAQSNLLIDEDANN